MHHMDDTIPDDIKKCIHFPICGGCNYLNIPYNEQLSAKRQTLTELFKPFNISIPNVIPSPECYYYRHKVQLPFGVTGRGKGVKIILGCNEANSHRVVDQNMCLIQDCDCTTVVKTIRTWAKDAGLTVYNRHTGTGFLRYMLLRRAHGTGEILIGLVTNGGRPKGSRHLSKMLLERLAKVNLSKSAIVGIVQNINTRITNVVLGNEDLVWWGRPYIKEQMGEWRYKIGLSTFFQVNPYQTPQLYNEVLSHIPEGTNVLDCYCGVGSIALWISKKAGSVLGIDENRFSIQDGRTAARINKADNVAFKHGDVEREIINLSQHDFQCAVLDPPREGLTECLIKTLNASAMERIIYVSCNAQTLKRDILHLQRRFRLVSLQPVDMFPHTEHIECVAVLELK